MAQSWTTDDVAQWLSGWEYPDLAEGMQEHAVDGEALLMLDHEALRDIGVAKVGTRLRVLRLIREASDVSCDLCKLGLQIDPTTMIRLQVQAGRLQRVEEHLFEMKQSVFSMQVHLGFRQDDVDPVRDDVSPESLPAIELRRPSVDDLSPGSISASSESGYASPPTALFERTEQGLDLEPRKYGSAPNLSSPSPPRGSKRPRPRSDPIPLWRESLSDGASLAPTVRSSFEHVAADAPTPATPAISIPSHSGVEALRQSRSRGLRHVLSHGALKETASSRGDPSPTPSPATSQRAFQNFFSAAKSMLQRSNSSSNHPTAPPPAKSPTTPVHEPAAIIDSLMIVGLMPASPLPPRPSRKRSVKARKSPPVTSEPVVEMPWKPASLVTKEARLSQELDNGGAQLTRPATNESPAWLYIPPPQVAPVPLQTQFRMQAFNKRRPNAQPRGPLRVAIPPLSPESGEKPLPTLPPSSLTPPSMSSATALEAAQKLAPALRP